MDPGQPHGAADRLHHPLLPGLPHLELLDTLTGLVIIYLTFNLSLVIWMMRPFFDQLPRSLEEAAWIDGATLWQGFYPDHPAALRPGLAATAILCFLFAWNDFFFALILTRTEAMTAPVAVVNFMNYEGWEWGQIAAGGTMVMLPGGGVRCPGGGGGAGVGRGGPGPRAAALERLFTVNTVGLMLCCREAARRMSTKRGGKGGVVVNVSSMAGTIGGRPSASAMPRARPPSIPFTMGFAKDVALEGIRAVSLRPGMIETEMTERTLADREVRAAIESTIAMGRVGQAEEIASAIVWLCPTRRASFPA